MSAYWSADWRCDDCGERVPIKPGQDTRPVSAAHECDNFRLATHQAERAGWETGYRFAVENRDDELVQADGDEWGTGWIGILREHAGGIRIEAGRDSDAPRDPTAGN